MRQINFNDPYGVPYDVQLAVCSTTLEPAEVEAIAKEALDRQDDVQYVGSVEQSVTDENESVLVIQVILNATDENAAVILAMGPFHTGHPDEEEISRIGPVAVRKTPPLERNRSSV